MKDATNTSSEGGIFTPRVQLKKHAILDFSEFLIAEDYFYCMALAQAWTPIHSFQRKLRFTSFQFRRYGSLLSTKCLAL